MSVVKVWNDNVHPYSEKFRGELIQIAAKSYIEMDEDEAENFKSAFTFPKLDGQEMPDPKFFKMIRIERTEPKAAAKVDPLMNHATGQKAASIEELFEFVKEHSHLLAKDPEADKFAESVQKQNKELKKENKELKSRLDLIEAHLGLKEEKVDGESL